MSEVTTPAFPRKVEWLDGLRGVAALAVLLAHIRNLALPDVMFARYVPLGAWIESSPLMLVTAGNLAVRIFFIHSGFVLSWKYLNRPDVRILASMCLRRCFRLGIPIAVAILFAFGLMRAGLMHNVEMGSLTYQKAPLVLHYRFEPSLSSALDDILGGWFVHNSVRYDGALWTMPIELLCSYIVFVLLPLLRSRVMTVVALAIATACIGWYAWLPYFLAGIAFVHMVRARAFPEVPAMVAWLVLILAATAGVFVPDEVVQFLSSTVIVAILFSHERWRHALHRPLAQFLGRTSFSVYLIHIPLLCSFSSALFIALHHAGLPHLANAIVTAIITIVVAYALSWAMWRWVDNFAINFGKAPLERYLYRADAGFAVPAASRPVPTPR